VRPGIVVFRVELCKNAVSDGQCEDETLMADQSGREKNVGWLRPGDQALGFSGNAQLTLDSRRQDSLNVRGEEQASVGDSRCARRKRSNPRKVSAHRTR
jgi:hypothetical protein